MGNDLREARGKTQEQILPAYELLETRPTSSLPLAPQLSAATLLSCAVAMLTTHGITNPRLEAEVLLAHTLGIERAGLYARLRDPVSLSYIATFRHLLQRRTRHEPLQYIIGVQEFWSLPFEVDPRVLIPRPETEMVVEVSLRLLQESTARDPRSPIESKRILDIGTGSGCIAIALATELSQAEIWAIDTCQDALIVARENARRHGVARQIRFLHGDFFTPVAEAGEEFDLLVSNPPYILHSDVATLQPEVRDWEPWSALDGGRDGLHFYRRLISEGLAYLRPGGWLVMEIGQGQHTAILGLIQEQPALTTGLCVPDYSGTGRVVAARKV